MSSTWIWISGWAICPDRFRSAVQSALPDYSHQVLAPTPDALDVVLSSNATHIGGYSLGGLLILSALERFPETANIICMAPFIAFCKEDRLGGTTPRATLRALKQRLREYPEKALQLFYRLAGLNDEPTDCLPYALEHLEWGLEQLINLRANTNLLNSVTGLVGLTDSLINYKTMVSKWHTCYFAEQCNHDYRKLIAALSQMNEI